MKKINSPRKAINFVVMLLALVVSGITFSNCGKDPVKPPDPPPPPPVLPAMPSLSMTADTALYDSSANVYIVTDAQVVTMNGKTVTSNGNTIKIERVKNDTLITIVGTNTNANGSTSKTVGIHVKSFSPRSTIINNYGKHHMTVNRGCLKGTEKSPNVVWIDGYIYCDKVQLFANGNAQITFGNCHDYPPYTTQIFYGWAWSDSTEKAIDYGPSSPSPDNVWFVTLGVNGYKEYRYDNNYYYEREYVKN